MTKLSAVESEARRFLRRMREEPIRACAERLRAVCESHWRELRGPEPGTPLARALWQATPSLADLFAALHAAGDPALADALEGLTAAQGLAALALAALERGDAEEARSAYEAMRAFESAAAGTAYAQAARARLAGADRPAKPHPHTSRPPLWKAVAAISAETGRADLNALLAAIEFLGAAQAGTAQAGDEAAQRILHALETLHIVFRGAERRGVRYELRGAAKKVASLHALGDMLREMPHR